METTKEGKQKLVEMLRRVQMQDTADADSDYDSDLHERLEQLDLNDANSEDILHVLSAKEKREFEAMLEDGRLSKLVELWQPWWLKDVPLVIVPADESASSIVSVDALAALPPISSLLRGKEPSDYIVYNLVSVLFAFAHASRLYNGDLSSTPVECSISILAVSKAVQQTNYSSLEAALNDCFTAVQDEASPQYSVAILQDVLKLLTSRGHAHVDTALAQLWQLFRLAKRRCRPPTDGAAADKKTKHDLFCAMKKIEFYASWFRDYKHCLAGVIAGLEVEFCQRSSDLAEYERLKTQIEKHLPDLKPKTGDARLIQEL